MRTTRMHYELPTPNPPEWEAGFYWWDVMDAPYFLSPEPGVAFCCDLNRLNGSTSWRLVSSEAIEAFQRRFVLMPKVTFDQPWASGWKGNWRDGFFLREGLVYFLAPKVGQAWWLDPKGRWHDSTGPINLLTLGAVPLARVEFEQEAR